METKLVRIVGVVVKFKRSLSDEESDKISTSFHKMCTGSVEVIDYHVIAFTYPEGMHKTVEQFVKNESVMKFLVKDCEWCEVVLRPCLLKKIGSETF